MLKNPTEPKADPPAADIQAIAAKIAQRIAQNEDAERDWMDWENGEWRIIPGALEAAILHGLQELLAETPRSPSWQDTQVQDALIELQAASWSRSWSRVKAARERLKELTGVYVPGPLSRTDAFALPASPESSLRAQEPPR